VIFFIDGFFWVFHFINKSLSYDCDVHVLHFVYLIDNIACLLCLRILHNPIFFVPLFFSSSFSSPFFFFFCFFHLLERGEKK
jgi:hypothetical protein